MSKLLEGLLFINETDVYKQYGVFLTEDKPGAHTNYDELLKPPAMKAYTSVAFREEDGEKLPVILPIPRFEARDVTLYFALVADTPASWFARYDAFLTLLKSGWLSIQVPELNKTYRMYFKEYTNYEQLTHLGAEDGYASRFKIKFREPKPSI